MKITVQVLMAQHGIRAGASDQVDPSLIADLAPKLRELINAQDAALYLGISVYLLRLLIADGMLAPDNQFNDRMVGFRPKTLDAFLDQWIAVDCLGHVQGRAAKTQLAIVARANRTRISQLLLAARDMEITFIRDQRRRGLAALCVAKQDVAALLKAAR